MPSDVYDIYMIPK